jgi:hypothetical protein
VLQLSAAGISLLELQRRITTERESAAANGNPAAQLLLGCDGFATPAQRGQLRQEGLRARRGGGGGERRWLKRSPIKKFYAVFSGGFMAGLVGQ